MLGITGGGLGAIWLLLLGIFIIGGPLFDRIQSLLDAFSQLLCESHGKLLLLFSFVLQSFLLWILEQHRLARKVDERLRFSWLLAFVLSSEELVHLVVRCFY